MSFQRTAGTIATILLLIVLLFIAVMLYNAKRNTSYPPEIASCPDYWKLDQETGNCVNDKGLGDINCPKNVNFNAPEWKGADGLEKKYRWAQNCGLVWQGVTNNSVLNE